LLLALLLAAEPLDATESSTISEEIEVSFDEETEEIDREDLDDLPPLPEYHYSKWLLGLPVACALVLAWNVRWRGGTRRHQRTRDTKPKR
jgi:hypothetical protein